MLITHPVQPYQGLQALLMIGVTALVRGAARGVLERARRHHSHVPEEWRARPLLRSISPPASGPQTRLPRTHWLARMLVATRPLTP